MGILVPLVAIIVPISDVINFSLRDSLDIYRKKISTFTIQMTRLE